MSIEATVYEVLNNANDVTDIVDDRIYPIVAKQDFWSGADIESYIVYRRNSTPSFSDLKARIDPSGALIELELWTTTFTAMDSLVHAVFEALQGYRGGDVQGIFLSDYFHEPATDHFFCAHLIFEVYSTEFIP